MNRQPQPQQQQQQPPQPRQHQQQQQQQQPQQPQQQQQPQMQQPPRQQPQQPQQQQQQQQLQQPAQMQPVYCIDVECVATGKGHNDRSVAQIGMVDQYERVVLDLYIKQTAPVVSYLEPLTGLNQPLLERFGIPLEEAINAVKRALPKNAILVGQNIGKDVDWLGLQQGVDFGDLIDLAGVTRCYNEKYKGYTAFGLDHVASTLLNWGHDGAAHNAVTDSIKSIRVYNTYLRLSQNPIAKSQADRALLSAPLTPSFAKQNPTFEDVCMGNRRTCQCGAVFFF